jgi:hypothetical protein
VSRPAVAFVDQADETSPAALGAAFRSGDRPLVRVDVRSEEFDQARELLSVWLVTTAFVVRRVTFGDADAVAHLTLRQASLESSSAQHGTEQGEPGRVIAHPRGV